MEIKILVETGETCGFKIIDITDENTGYLPEENSEYTKGRFKYSDTVTISLLGILKSTQEIINYDTMEIKEHSDKKEIYMSTLFDGHFKLAYIILPTEKCYLENKNHLEDYPEGFFFFKDTNIFKGSLDTVSMVSWEDIFNILRTLGTDVSKIKDLNNTTLSIIQNDYISICFLKQCFINLCKKIFEKRAFNKCAYKGNILNELIYRRDLVWMAINIISYLTEFGLLNEALRIIEIMSDCNGICKQEYREFGINGCGCS